MADKVLPFEEAGIQEWSWSGGTELPEAIPSKWKMLLVSTNWESLLSGGIYNDERRF
jgi:hypothetical protein